MVANWAESADPLR